MNKYSVLVAHWGEKTNCNSYERTVYPNQYVQPSQHQPQRKSEMVAFWHCDVKRCGLGVDGLISDHRRPE